MRRSGWTALAFMVALAGCEGEDVAPPHLQRPIEALPPGPRAVLLASDLRNTWQRVEAHDLRTALESWPGTAKVMRDSAVTQFLAACRAFETKTGTQLQEDLVLNVVGGRAGVGVYPRAAGAPRDSEAAPGVRDHDVVLVADLNDAARFRGALMALCNADLAGGPAVRQEDFEGAPAWRLENLEGRSVRIVQQDGFVAAATDDDLLRQALALHAAPGASALRDSSVQAALHALGAHNLVAIAALDAGGWSANGFTWDRSGLHFDQTTSALRGGPAPAARASEVWASIPDGMTFAAYVRHRDLDLGKMGRALRFGAVADAGPVRAAGAGGMPMLPDLSRPWVGDAIGIALRGMEPTTLAPVPDVAFIVQVRDAAAADADLRSLEGTLRGVPLGPAARGFEDVHYGGRTYRSWVQPLSETVSPSWIVDGDVAIVATTRTLMQQILDARRTGKRTIRSDASFRRFKTFVPDDAAAVFYADQRRLHHVAEELGQSSSLWGPQVAEGIDFVQRWSGVLEHFPAGAAYVTRDDKSVSLRGWMAEPQ